MDISLDTLHITFDQTIYNRQGTGFIFNLFYTYHKGVARVGAAAPLPWHVTAPA